MVIQEHFKPNFKSGLVRASAKVTMNLDIDLNLEECNKDTVEHANDSWEDDECEKSLEPYKGMEFDSQDDAYSFYLKYSKFIGFGISKKSSRRSKISGEFIDVKIVCTRYGLKKEKDVSGTRHSQKVDCKAILHVKKNTNGKWYAPNFVKDHTHELFPAHAHYLPYHRSIDSSIKENIDTLHVVGVGTSKIYTAMAKKHGGYENIGFLEKDIRNHLDKKRRLTLASGDAKAMLEHFMHMQEENPNFFFPMDLDEEQRLKNVFWVDAKSREDYKKTSWREFVEKYKVAIRDREEKETHANFNTWHKKPPLKSPSPFEKQTSTIYTHEIFKKLQVEVLGASACFCLNEGDNGMKKTFKVQDFEKNVNFIVTWNVSHKEATCMCRKFEFYGFLCRHVICVLQSLGIFYVPPDYILQRWTKNAKAFDSIKINSSGVQSKKQRFDELIHQATKLSEEASSSNETYIIAYRVLKEALEKCVTMNYSLKKFELYEACDVEEEDMDSNKLHDTSLHDPQISSTKGAPKRIKSGIEKSRKKKPTTNQERYLKMLCYPKMGRKNVHR
ncbi:hypothetical protein Dsin_020511 [Dipteronia sinensis]|uniref:Protein FAR1-RELATED SEQUENCE n=1 Tax=Dipteronia sinensis TaxID=43782 RepID=A0AAE0A9L5_9ROSI|nr:hypothetical protein Dsin_020511 [Dipteronia sinensis]